MDPVLHCLIFRYGYEISLFYLSKMNVMLFIAFYWSDLLTLTLLLIYLNMRLYYDLHKQKKLNPPHRKSCSHTRIEQKSWAWDCKLSMLRLLIPKASGMVHVWLIDNGGVNILVRYACEIKIMTKCVTLLLGYVTKLGSEKVRVLKLVHNRGKGGAVRMGMLRAR
jgi:hypothetical protein